MEADSLKGHHKAGSTSSHGKHSVEVNVRIKKNRRYATDAHDTPDTSFRQQFTNMTPLPKYNAPESFRRGSWADLLSRVPTAPGPRTPLQEIDAGDVGLSTNMKHRTHSVTETSMATQTTQTDDMNELRHEGCEEANRYISTITQLHQLCTHLKEEVNQLSLAKDMREDDLLAVIKEKDKIISIYREHPQRHEQPVPVPPAAEAATAHEQTEELNRIHGVIRDVRQLMSVELDAMKRRMNSPLPTPEIHEKFLLEEEESWLNDTGGVGGGGDIGKKTDPQRSTSSRSNIISGKEVGPDGELDSSTQYMDLPNRR